MEALADSNFAILGDSTLKTFLDEQIECFHLSEKQKEREVRTIKTWYSRIYVEMASGLPHWGRGRGLASSMLSSYVTVDTCQRFSCCLQAESLLQKAREWRVRGKVASSRD
jgi:hypothetical protein